MSVPSPEQQQRARVFGVLFALTFITSITGLLRYDPVFSIPEIVFEASITIYLIRQGLQAVPDPRRHPVRRTGRGRRARVRGSAVTHR